MRFEVTNKSLLTSVSITKTGPREAMANQPVNYTFSGIANTSNVMLTSFYWRDTLPAEVRLNTVVTGTYNFPGAYKITYRVNGGEYRTLADNLSTGTNYTLNASPAALGLASNERVTEIMFVFGQAPAGFAQVEAPKLYCLLYLPFHPPEMTNSGYFDELAAEIAALLDACWGHALVLFTSYAAMSAIKERLAEMDLPWDIFTLGRNAVHTTRQFKAEPGSVLLATGAAWEGFDFPGDCVSLLVIPRLPFSHPDALKEKKRAEYPDLRSFIRAVVVPEMQIKLKQGFGRAIRTETDTCVIAILDERSAPGQRHFEAMKAALPEMRVTDSLEDVVEFIYRVKGSEYFEVPHHEKTSDV